MRRTIRNMRLLGSMDPIMSELTVAAIGAMGPQYPELVNDTKRILSVSVSEEESFLQTLKSGTQIFDVASAALKRERVLFYLARTPLNSMTHTVSHLI